MAARPRLILATAFGGIVVLLSGCSGPVESAQEETPLTPYMNAVYGGDLSEEEQQARFDEQNTQREELTATCMTEEGFEYIPNTASSSLSFSSGEEWKPDDRDWVAQYGYGMIDYPGRDEPVDPEQVTEDPNADYVQSLSESEQTAYWEALYGASPSEEELAEDGSYEYDWTKGGCSGMAQHEVQDADPLATEEFAALSESLNDFWNTMQDGPGFAELNSAWAACMDEAGQPGFTEQVEAQQSINDEYNAMWENVTEGPGPTPDSPEMVELGEKEIALALIDLDCREDVDFRDGSQAAQFAAEEKFVADHKTELEALKAAAEQARS